MHRISSTQLATWLDCPRKWYYNHVLRRGRTVSEAMANGTIFHAIMEHRLEYGGDMPTRYDVSKQPGNYDPPRKALRLFPHTWDLAYGMAKIIDIEALDIRAPFEIELDLETFGLRLDGDIRAGGYIDLFDRERRIITDWKTRRRFDYAPRTRMDFIGNVQLCYYGAAVVMALDWPDITVRHVNVLRAKKPRVMLAEATLTREELEPLWTMLDKTIVPQMKEDAAREERAVRTNTDICFKYGPCPHLKTCGAHNPDGLSPITRRLRGK